MCRSKCSVRRKLRPQCIQIRALAPRAPLCGWGDGDIETLGGYGELVWRREGLGVEHVDVEVGESTPTAPTRGPPGLSARDKR